MDSLEDLAMPIALLIACLYLLCIVFAVEYFSEKLACKPDQVEFVWRGDKYPCNK